MDLLSRLTGSSCLLNGQEKLLPWLDIRTEKEYDKKDGAGQLLSGIVSQEALEHDQDNG